MGLIDKGSDIPAPEPFDIRKSIEDYVTAVSDPVLRDQILQAERTDRPLFRALDLQDINTMASGVQAGPNPEYARIQSEIAALEAGGVAAGRERSKEELEAEALEKFGPMPSGKGTTQARKKIQSKIDAYVESGGPRGERDTARAEEIASLKSRLANTPQNLEATKGLFDLQDEASRRAGATTREALGLQRQDDFKSFKDLSGKFVEASRAADPESTRLAEMASARAGQETGLGARGQELLGSQVQDASAAERALQNRGMSDVNAELRSASAAERAIQSRGLSDINARREAASAAERQLQEMGMTLGDLSPTEQEALISARGSEFIQSTGELSPLEQRRAQQSARQGSLARGREMGQGSLYDEMLARQSEELNKQERQVALGSQLLGQEAGMRGSRLGQGAGMLQGSESLAAQRRLEQMQRQQFGAQSLGLVDDMESRRIQQQLERQQFGTSTLGMTEDMAARRRAEQIQRMKLGAGFIGQEEGIQTGRFGQAFDMNRGLAGDLGSTILGRPSYATQLGSQTLGAAQQGAQQSSGPKLYDSNMGINIGLQDQANQYNYASAQMGADATRSAANSQMAGQIAVALAPKCWVAREVYGIDNPKWLQFREWLNCEAPRWFDRLYIKYGERFAKFISNKPVLKNIIRKWMNTKIK